MFGLEGRDKKKSEPFVFEIEKDWRDAKKYQDTLATISTRIQAIKNALKGGEDQESFDQLVIVLHGYSSLLKVMARCVANNKK